LSTDNHAQGGGISVQDMMKIGITLALVCAIAAGALALTNSATAGIIEQRKADELQRMLTELLPSASTFEPITTEDGAMYYLAYKGDDVAGAIMVGQATGYGGPLQLLVSIDQDGVIKQTRVLAHGETIGIGTRATEPDFLDQFINHSTDARPVAGQTVDLIQGATISSRAMMAAINDALDTFAANVMGEEEETINLARVPNGTYQGEADGFLGPIKVTVTVADGKITKVVVDSHNDTPEIAGAAVDAIPDRIVEEQNWKVDAVSGATFTSKGIMDAVKAALPDTSLKLEQIADGTHAGEAEGFLGPMKVEVTISDGKITEVKVVSHADTPDIANPALSELRDRMVEQQTWEVDAVSGATYSSKGFVQAVINALENAPLR
jgi:RnfABCDGE-type electron transport complex G subunit